MKKSRFLNSLHKRWFIEVTVFSLFFSSSVLSQEWFADTEGFVKGEIKIKTSDGRIVTLENNTAKNSNTPPMVVVGSGGSGGAFEVAGAYHMSNHVLVIFDNDLGAMKMDEAKFNETFTYDEKVDLVSLSENNNWVTFDIPIRTSYDATVAATKDSSATCSAVINGQTYATSVSGAGYGKGAEVSKTVAIPNTYLNGAQISGELSCMVTNGSPYNAVVTYDNTSECTRKQYKEYVGNNQFPATKYGYGEIYSWYKTIHTYDPYYGPNQQTVRTEGAEYLTEEACLLGETQYDVRNYSEPFYGFRMSGITVDYRPDSIWGVKTSAASASLSHADYNFSPHQVGTLTSVCNEKEFEYDPIYDMTRETCIESTRTSSYVPLSSFINETINRSGTEHSFRYEKQMQGWLKANPRTGHQMGWTEEKHYHPKTGEVLPGGGPYVFTNVVPYGVAMDPSTGDIYVNYGRDREDTEITPYNYELKAYSGRYEPFDEFYSPTENERVRAVFHGVKPK